MEEEQTLNEILSGGEGPEEGTAHDVDEDGYTTVAGGETDEEPTDKPQGEDQSEVEARAKFWQSGYQSVFKHLDEMAPDISPLIRERVKADRAGIQADPSQQTAAQQTFADPPVESDDPYMDKLNAIERNMAKTVQGAVGAMMQQQQQAAYIQAVQREQVEASRAMETMIAQGQVPKEVLDSALAEVGGYNIDLSVPGGPTGAVKALARVLRESMTSQGAVSRAAAEAAAKAKAIAQVAQPNAAAAPPEQKLTKEEQLLKQMNDAGSAGDAASAVFGS